MPEKSSEPSSGHPSTSKGSIQEGIPNIQGQSTSDTARATPEMILPFRDITESPHNPARKQENSTSKEVSGDQGNQNSNRNLDANLESAASSSWGASLPEAASDVSKNTANQAAKKSTTKTNTDVSTPSDKRSGNSSANIAKTTDRGAVVSIRKSKPKDKAHKGTRMLGLDRSLPPLNNLKDIFHDISRKAVDMGLKEALAHVGTNPLKIATMCSGTECPILALDMIKECLEEFGQAFYFVQLFSAEIDPVKQAYIERNFRPPILFRDVTELDRDRASTAYGSVKDVPKDADILIAGTSCVDYSPLNNNKKTFIDVQGNPTDKSGESKDTFLAVTRYANKHRPTIVICENVSSAPWDWMKSKWEEIDYATIAIQVDTKFFYIPQTRQRAYAVSYDRRKIKEAQLNEKELLRAWIENVQYFVRKASCPVQEFILPEDDVRYLQARKDTESGLVQREETDWARCKTRHFETRNLEQLGHQKPMTNWKEGGIIKMFDYCWARWGLTQVQRIMDTLDMNYLRGIDCAKGHPRDITCVTRVLNLSQNVDRDKDSCPPGIIGCITPNGMPFSTTRGGPLHGTESLMLQGIPAERLALTRLTAKQQQNLAGNAMSSTIVGPAILSALMTGFKLIPQSRREEQMSERSSKSNIHHIQWKQVQTLDYSNDLSPRNIITAQDLTRLASQCPRLCLCEGNSVVKTDAKFFQCKSCRYTACEACHGNPKHEYEEMDKLHRIPQAECTEKILAALPMRLVLEGFSPSLVSNPFKPQSEDAWEFLDSLGWVGEEVRFKSIRRGWTWSILYNGDRTSLELKISTHSVQWCLFAKPNPQLPLNSKVRDVLACPIARMQSTHEFLSGDWEIFHPIEKTVDLQVSGSGSQIDCYQKRIGLEDQVYKDRKAWKNIHVTRDRSSGTPGPQQIFGEYELLAACGTAMGCLHRKIRDINDNSVANEDAVYLFFDQDQAGLKEKDCFIFSENHRRLEYGVTRDCFAKIPYKKDDKDSKFEFLQTAIQPDPKVVDCVIPGHWQTEKALCLCVAHETQRVNCSIPDVMAIGEDISAGFTSSLCAQKYIPILDCSTNLGGMKRPMIDAHNALGEIPAAISDLSWLVPKVNQISQFADWQLVYSNGPFHCTTCVPPKPRILWNQNANFQPSRPYEDMQDAGEYEDRLRSRPIPAHDYAYIRDQDTAGIKVGINVNTLIHRADARLAWAGPINAVSYSWRLVCSASLLQRPPPITFQIPDNKRDVPYSGPLNFNFSLRPEQQRSLTWMVEMDKYGAGVSEEETEEYIVPSMGWRFEARAAGTKQVRGGVIADDVGYGKTATTLALFDATRTEKDPLPDSPPGAILLNATLILVPDHLVRQWEGEIKKFFALRPEVIVVRNRGDLKKLTLGDFHRADIIIMPWKMLVLETSGNMMADMYQFAASTYNAPEPSANTRTVTDWFNNAMTGLEESADVLRSMGIDALASHLQSRFEGLRSRDKATDASDFRPSKRHVGQAYQKAKAASGPNRTSSGSKADSPSTIDPASRNATTDSDTEVTDVTAGIGQGVADNLGSSNSSKPIGSNSRKRKADEISTHERPIPNFKETFNLVQGGEVDKLKNPPLHIFQFRRIIIDEVSYLEKFNCAAIVALKAVSKWILSATPPLKTFEDVRILASLVGVNLGIQDTDTALGDEGVKNKNSFTAAEIFGSYEDRRSMDWHKRRNEVAQVFLNTFARSNKPEIDEIPFHSVIHPVYLSSKERATYMEAFQHLAINGVSLAKTRSLRPERTLKASKDQFNGRAKLSKNARREGLNKILGNSKSIHEGLLYAASDFMVVEEDAEMSEEKKSSNVVAPKSLSSEDWIERRKQEKDLLLQVMKETAEHMQFLNHRLEQQIAAENATGKLKNTKTGKPLRNAYAHLKEQSTQDCHWSAHATAELKRILYESGKEFDKNDKGLRWYRFPTAAEVKALKKKKEKTDDDDEDEHDEDPAEEGQEPEAAIVTSQRKKVLPQDSRQTAQFLKHLTHYLREDCGELDARVRSIRLLQSIEDCQNQQRINPDCPDIRCHGCAMGVYSEHLNILTTCGHVVCSACLPPDESADICPIPGCLAPEYDYLRTKPSSLMDPVQNEYSKKHGSKIGLLVQLLKGEIGGKAKITKEDSVIVFAQFERMKTRLCRALEDEGVSYVSLGAEDPDAIEKFQRYGGKGGKDEEGKQILVLTLDNEDSSGHNLTKANHIVFLAPLLTANQRDYASYMKQAIGRAVRYGQKRGVYEHRLYALHSVEVNIVQQREKKVMVKRGNEFLLVEKDQISEGDEIGFEGGAVPQEADFCLDDEDYC